MAVDMIGPSVSLHARGDYQGAVLEIDILRPASVVLHFLVSPASATGYGRSLRRIRSRAARMVELIAPDELPAGF